MLGDLLRQYRQRLGLSQEELAERVTPTLSITTIGNIERGRTRPYRHTLLSLCAALALTPEEQAATLEAWRGGTVARDGSPARLPASAPAPDHSRPEPASPPATEMLTVLIADLRGYTAFTHQH